MIIARIENESNLMRKKLLILYLLSYIDEFANNTLSITVPSYIMQAMVYIEEHYYEKITAAELARKLHIGRTTLMTMFKKHTGFTLNNYIVQCRLKKALTLFQEGKTEYEIAERCGFGDISGLIRSFKNYFGMTPRQYFNSRKK
ncbi:MAG: helix-turn-helix transcriptional regulator [Clostridia bacterium]|nr:helix-turn-helix transcriptional regulator [Clostridia bacterium]